MSHFLYVPPSREKRMVPTLPEPAMLTGTTLTSRSCTPSNGNDVRSKFQIKILELNFRNPSQTNTRCHNGRARVAPPPLRPRPCNFGQLPDRQLPTSSPNIANCQSYAARPVRALASLRLSKVTGPWAQRRWRSARGHCESVFHSASGLRNSNSRILS